MVLREMPEYIYYKCPECDDITEHEILKGRMGKESITGTFRCSECARIFSGAIKIPREIVVKVLFSDADITETTETTIESDDLLTVGDEFYMDDGRRVCLTHIDTEDGRNVIRSIATKIVSIWVKQFDILSVKVSINNNKVTIPARVEAEPDDEFTIGMMIEFDEFNCVVNAIKTKYSLVKKGSAEARDITRIYGKLVKKTYDVLEFDEDEFEFREEDFEFDEEEEIEIEDQ